MARWRHAFGCNAKAIRLYRICLSMVLTLELVLRFRYLEPFYSEEGTLPMRLLRPRTDALYRAVCVHCLSGSLWFQRLVLTVQVVLAIAMGLPRGTFGLHLHARSRQWCAAVSWVLYLSLTLRNTWLSYILDRYFHYLLFYAVFLFPLEEIEEGSEKTSTSTSTSTNGPNVDVDVVVCNVATVCYKLQVLWIYLDAGYGKYSDPLGGWTYGADPLPALDTYARHTYGARMLQGLLGPYGLRLLTPTVVWVELLVGPVAVLASARMAPRTVQVAIGTICSLHLGIALTLRNTGLLSAVACCAWAAFWPPVTAATSFTKWQVPSPKSHLAWWQAGLVLALVAGSTWFETHGIGCTIGSNQDGTDTDTVESHRHIWSTLLHNRWNVFVGAEEYVTWEIAPGRLADGSVVDVWSRTPTVNWEMPVSGAACTSTARYGRWRSFPYLAGLNEGEDAEALWGYLCREWNRPQGQSHANPDRYLLRYNFFMLQADVLPNMAFSPTRKRLIHSHVCSIPSSDSNNQDKHDDEQNNDNQSHNGEMKPARRQDNEL